MNKHIKKLLCAAVSLAMAAGTVILPMTASAAPATWDANATSWKFDFGASDAVADDYIGVSADTKYSATTGYGFLGLENGFALDSREDGWTMTQGYDLVLENGKKDTVTTADDDWVATTTRTEKDQDYNSPIRFSMKVTANTYYTVKVHLVRANAEEEAIASLFTEKRHQHFVNKSIPEDGLTYEASVYVHNNWSKNTSEYVDTQLSIAAAGDNVAISSIEITKTDQGKTLWVLTDSTGCQQTAPIPYFPLDHCQGIGSAMAKYIGEDWALVNEGESGLSSSAAANHWNNCKNDVKAGDVVWFQFGHNNERGQQVDELISSLNTYYADVHAKGAKFLVVSPVERDTTDQYKDGTWTSTLSKYADAGSEWVNEKLTGGADDVAYLDLNTASVQFLNDVQETIDNGRQAASLQSLGAATTRFYYYVSKYSDYKADYTHPNDYGADNSAKIIVDLAKEKITAAAQAGATDAQKTEAAVLSSIFGDSTRAEEAVSVSEEIYKDGAAPNSYYPTQLAKVVLYDYPIIVNKVTFDETNKPNQMTVKLVASKLEFKYGRGVIVIKDSGGQIKGTIKTTDTIDSVAGDTQIITFDTAGTATFDAAAGDTFEAYVINITEGVDSHDEDDVIISTKYTQNDMVDIKDYLLQGATGMENIEDFSTYDLTDGQTIIGKNGWSNPGGETFAFKQEGDLTFAHCATTGGATYYPEKKFTAQSSGKLYCRLDVRYISGTFNLYFTDGTALNNWPAGRVMPLQIVTADGEVQVKLDGTKVATVNSGEWVTYALTIDFDYGKYTLSLNGQTYESDFAAYQSNEVNLVPSNLSMIAFQNDKSSNEYDVTNIVLATLNTATLPDKTLTVASNDDTKGKVSIVKDGEAVEGTTAAATMNSIIKAVAAPEEGFEFEKWVDEAGTTVSYSQEYEMRLHSDTNLTAQFKEAVVDPITYSYKEEFSTLSTNTLKDDGWVSVNAQAATTIQMDDDHGNYLRIAPGNDNSRGLLKDFGVNLTDNYVVEMDLALTAGNDQATNLSLYNAASTTSNTNGQSMNAEADNYVFDLDADAGSSTWKINRTDGDTVTIPAGTWIHLTVIVKDGTVSYIIENGDNVLKKGTTTAKGGVDLKGLHLRQGRYNGETKFDNIRIYTADQYVEPEVPPTEYSVAIDDGKISVESPAAGTYTALYAVYKDNVLVGVKSVDVTFTEAAKQSVDIPQNDFAGDSFKVMLWKTLSGAQSLCAPAAGTIEG